MNQSSLKILTILSVLGDPRDSKRISMLQQAGFVVEVVAFERNYHSGRLPDCPVKKLGKIAHGHYFQRIFKIALALPTIRRAIRNNHLIYTSGPDMALAAIVARWGLNKPIVLEVGDVRELQVAKGIKGYVVRIIDKYIVNACQLLVVTTPSFLKIYYRQWLKTKTPAMVIENKLETSSIKNENSKNIFGPMIGKPLINRPLRIGYFGLLRDEWSWQVLKTLALAQPQNIEILLAGYPINPIDLPQQVKKYNNIKYFGEYHCPQDLPLLYNNIDMVWACYPYIGPSDWNLRWARPNRFYESCFFQKPTFTRDGCQDAVDVEHYKIGMIIKDHDIGKVVKTICKIKSDDLAFWQNNMSKLPSNVYMYTTESVELETAIKNILANYLNPLLKN